MGSCMTVHRYIIITLWFLLSFIDYVTFCEYYRGKHIVYAVITSVIKTKDADVFTIPIFWSRPLI